MDEILDRMDVHALEWFAGDLFDAGLHAEGEYVQDEFADRQEQVVRAFYELAALVHARVVERVG